MTKARLNQVIASITFAALAPAAFAQTAVAAETPPDAPAAAGHDGGWKHGHHHGMGHMAARAAIHDLREIKHLYLETGRANELPALYQDVLSKTQDPFVRNYAYQELARAELRPADPDKAIATLRTSLNENLTKLNAHPAAQQQ
ncbi:hypothetical protein [Paraburkholderia oxyphila]|uniref:hypothetical protein n=1 Tax=Paraburkholderia oxyphila TaxID=614212 RepID=UPI00048727FB|nr:hypothetical protein [Paraburkholderia oxyphila]